MFKQIAAVVLTAASFAASASTNLVVNGSFEDTILANKTYTTTTVLNGWTTAAAGVELRNNVIGTAEDGVNFAELDTNRNSSISQTLANLSGTYLLTFWVSDRADKAKSTGTYGLTYTIGTQTFTVDESKVSSTGWTEVSQLFTGNGSTLLSFAATGLSDGFGNSLDNISVTSVVPEPSSMLLLAAGLGLVGLARRRQAR